MTLQPVDARQLLRAVVLVLLACAIAAAGGWWMAARAHDEAEWIMRGGYRSPITGEHCCGPQDCSPIAAVDVIETAEGWRIVSTGERIPVSEGQKSRDGRYWRCHRPNGTRRCWFYPPGMS